MHVNFPKFIALSGKRATALKLFGAIASLGVGVEIYLTTADWKLAAAAVVTSLLSGNVVTQTGSATSE